VRRGGKFTLIFGIIALIAAVVHLMVGSVFVYSPIEVIQELASGRGGGGAQSHFIIWELRLPRALSAALVGAALATTGGGFQALFRNPLADPYIVGVSSGAAVGGVASIALGFPWGLVTIGMAFISALLGLIVVIAIARIGGTLSLQTLLLTGVGVGSFLWALVTLILVSAGQDAGRILYWLLGSFVGANWTKVGVLFVSSILFGCVLAICARPLTIFSVGEESAGRLGVETERLKWWVLIAGCGLAATAVASVGIIGFVGLFVPHIARKYVGPDLRALLPACLFLGAAAVMIADLIAQRAIHDTEVNVGIVTAIIGAPFLVFALRRKTVGSA
jgi:iron complex transport system permease protein